MSRWNGTLDNVEPTSYSAVVLSNISRYYLARELNVLFNLKIFIQLALLSSFYPVIGHNKIFYTSKLFLCLLLNPTIPLPGRCNLAILWLSLMPVDISFGLVSSHILPY